YFLLLIVPISSFTLVRNCTAQKLNFCMNICNCRFTLVRNCTAQKQNILGIESLLGFTLVRNCTAQKLILIVF
ncbi:hypothetical protein Q4504_04000, partial [Mesomycoplasma ovipneumoniae]|uniref:hypothetical protein n=1 Tax=Mesomycoplasma ovipneumoniae TaxID=29562 RepID=UPI0026E2B48D